MTKSLSHLKKFIVVGVISTLINYSCFYILTRFAITGYLTASVVGYIVGLFAGYFLNNFWTFQRSDFNVTTIIGYCAVYGFSLGLSTLFLWLMVTKLQYNKYFMNASAICLSTISNFLGLKLLIYKSNESQQTV